jgi:GTP-binding protein
VDLPGYGYARGGDKAAREFARLAAGYFGVATPSGRPGPEAALLLVDSRHPGLATDVEAWRWLSGLPLGTAIVATKIDKLGRAERARAIRDMERSFDSPVLPVSATTGEGMETLWKLIARLASPHPRPETPA